MRLQECFEDFLRDGSTYWAPSSYQYYKRNVDYFFNYLANRYRRPSGSMELSELPETILAEYVVWLRSKEKYAGHPLRGAMNVNGTIKNNTVNTYMCAVKCFFNYLYRRKYTGIRYTEGLKLPRSDDDQIVPLLASEVYRIDWMFDEEKPCLLYTSGGLFHGFSLGCAAHAGYGEANVYGGAHSGEEQVALQEDLAVGDGDDVGRNVGGHVARLGLDDGQGGNGPAAQLVAQTAGAFQQSGVQVEHFAGVCRAARRAFQQQGQGPVGHRVLGPVSYTHLSSKKAKVENFITKFARYYTPAVVIGAVILAVLPPLLLGQSWAEGVRRACTFLVISCPCALVISVPMSFFGGIGAASRKGVLVKGSNFLEALSNMTTIVFDKTGTLTRGEFKVTEILPGSMGKEELLELTAYAESYSDHPISRSILEAWGREPDRSRVRDNREIAGHGLEAVVDGRTVLAGNEKLMIQNGVAFETCSSAGLSLIHI